MKCPVCRGHKEIEAFADEKLGEDGGVTHQRCPNCAGTGEIFTTANIETLREAASYLDGSKVHFGSMHRDMLARQLREIAEMMEFINEDLHG